MTTNSKEYTNAYQKEHYKLNRQKYIDKTERWKKKRRAWVNDLKNHPCMDCGERYPTYVMDWDHARGKKKFNLGVAATKGKSLKAILEEIAKCDLVCANCHRERTHKRRSS